MPLQMSQDSVGGLNSVEFHRSQRLPSLGRAMDLVPDPSKVPYWDRSCVSSLRSSSKCLKVLVDWLMSWLYMVDWLISWLYMLDWLISWLYMVDWLILHPCKKENTVHRVLGVQ